MLGVVKSGPKSRLFVNIVEANKNVSHFCIFGTLGESMYIICRQGLALTGRSSFFFESVESELFLYVVLPGSRGSV